MGDGAPPINVDERAPDESNRSPLTEEGPTSDSDEVESPEVDAAAGPGVEDRPQRSGATGERSVFRQELFRFLELFALCGIAVAQPMLDLYGHNPDEFVINRLSGPLVLLFAFSLILVPPAVLFLVTLPLRLVSTAVEAFAQRVVLSALIGFTVMQALQVFITPVLWGIFAVIVIVGTYLLGRFAAVRSWVRFLAPAPVIFLVMFLFASEASPVLLGDPSSVPPLGGVTVTKPVPVVLLVFDELPLASLMDGKSDVDEVAFPNFAALRKGSTWYPNSSSVSPNTPYAVPAILTGKYPPTRKSSVAQNYPLSLFTMLGQPYKMHVQEAVTELCPSELCTRFTGSGAAGGPSSVLKVLKDASRAWTERLDTGPTQGQTRVDIEQFGAGADGTDFKDPERLESFEKSLSSSANNQLYMLHAVLPHFPWVMHPSGRTYRDSIEGSTPGLFNFSWTTTQAAASARQRHLLQLQYVDKWLGRFIEKMKSSGLWDKALIIVTADHGISFQKGEPYRGVTKTNAWEVMWTPLFIRGPGFTPNKMDKRAAESVDVVPTIADVLGVTPKFDFDGVSLLTPKASERPKRYSHVSPFSRLEDVKNGYGQVEAEGNFQKVMDAEAFGRGSDDLRFFRVNEFAPLIGKQVDQVPKGDPSADVFKFDGSGAKREFDPSKLDVETFVKVTGERAADVAIALNGTIVAAGPVEQSFRGEWRYWTVFPDTRLKPGENTIELFTIDKSGASHKLRPARVAES